jgi:hypothetical protein
MERRTQQLYELLAYQMATLIVMEASTLLIYCYSSLIGVPANSALAI